MIIIKISILSILFIFAMGTDTWSDSNKSMKDASSRITTMKMDENNGIVQKKRPAVKPVKPIKKGTSKLESTSYRPEERGAFRGKKKDVDFLKAIEEKKRQRWIDLHPILSSPEFLRDTGNNPLLASRVPSIIQSSATNDDPSLPKPFPSESKYFGGGTRIEILRHLESKREDLFREIFMGLRFSFIPASRHVILEMNIRPSSEKGPGLVIPF